MDSVLPLTNLKKLVSVEKLALAAIAIAILLRIVNLGSREFWYDEVLSLLLSNGHNGSYSTPKDLPVLLADYTSLLQLPLESSLSELISTFKKLILNLLNGEPHPPIFFLSQHLWLRLFGNSEPAMRSLNLLFSIAAIFSSYSLGKVLLNHRSGLLLAAFIAVNPFYLFHSLNVRMYAPLVLWTSLSAVALIHIINHQQTEPTTKNLQHRLVLNILFVTAVAAGLLTFYLYAYWVITLTILVIYLDRKHWWQHGLRLATAVMITIPWFLWGGIKQFRNADLNRFAAKQGIITAFFNHLQDFFYALGTNILVGDWVTRLPVISVAAFGVLVVVFMLICSLHLWHKNEQQNLFTSVILGISPLLLSLAVDILTKKNTLGFGWGRTTIIILPGCLLLFVVWLEQAVSQEKRTIVAASLLILYLGIGISDFSLRQRTIFHQIANVVTQENNHSTLIAMNSKAWGHVMRLAYYIPPQLPVMLLADSPNKLADSLANILNDEKNQYQRVIWLDSADPVWSRLKTAAEIQTAQQNIQQVLSPKFNLQQTQNLRGTMEIDDFTLKLYTHSNHK
ncbi:glycosyltransferase family 39 protein [Nostoc sp. CMAA1605]|uniref:glycosyltransferase family 39 protein n=1 Tax=Nostoc sp. CMAA1605 TaxID=2055159 RepID=UPI001F186327|nr:glycosyltransferase family 39 protein [Nostoc sp. CMAA1605]MCF4969001.1 hypothetical protein [Nostoc sp. CMAA1605]